MDEQSRSAGARRPDVQAFLDAVQASFAARAADVETARCVHETFALLDRAVSTTTRAEGLRLPACAALPRALAAASAAGPDLAGIASTFAAIEPSVSWARRMGGSNASANIANGHANGMVVGPGGIEDRTDAWVGVSLLAPHVRYPDHQHAPEEAYLLLSPGEFRQGTGDWFEPGLGGSFFNVPNVVHAMRSGDEPLLAVWCLRPEPNR